LRNHLSLLDSADYLLVDILAVCGDTKNRAAYQKVIREYPESLLRMALSETRQADREQRVKRTKGAYFMDAVKRLAHLRGAGKSSSK
jgi:hypothetical protein